MKKTQKSPNPPRLTVPNHTQRGQQQHPSIRSCAALHSYIFYWSGVGRGAESPRSLKHGRGRGFRRVMGWRPPPRVAGRRSLAGGGRRDNTAKSDHFPPLPQSGFAAAAHPEDPPNLLHLFSKSQTKHLAPFLPIHSFILFHRHIDDKKSIAKFHAEHWH